VRFSTYGHICNILTQCGQSIHPIWNQLSEVPTYLSLTCITTDKNGVPWIVIKLELVRESNNFETDLSIYMFLMGYR